MNWNPEGMDVFEFFRQFQIKKTTHDFKLSGELPLDDFKRLCEGLPAQTGGVHWSVVPNITKLNERILNLHVQATMVLTCQRCMKPMMHIIDSEVALRVLDADTLLETQVDFDHLDELAAEPYDDVVGSTSFSMSSEIEDELILNLPYLPTHDQCELMHDNDYSDISDKKPSPFSVLSQLKKKN